MPSCRSGGVGSINKSMSGVLHLDPVQLATDSAGITWVGLRNK